MEFLFIIAAIVAVKHFCRVPAKSFTQTELPAIHQTGMSRSEYRANARRFR